MNDVEFLIISDDSTYTKNFFAIFGLLFKRIRLPKVYAIVNMTGPVTPGAAPRRMQPKAHHFARRDRLW